jgi:hypothetical protein
MSDVLLEVVLIAATMAMGLMAGVFGIYGNAIMPGLRRTDDRTFVAAFQSIDRAIINPVFMVTFFGALALTACPGSQRHLFCTSSSLSSPSASTCRATTRSRPRVTWTE